MFLQNGDFKELERPSRHGLPERGLALLIAALFLLSLGAAVYFYLAGDGAGSAPTPTPAPPAATPITDAAGEVLLLEAYVLDVQGDCFFARAADGSTLLVDAGCGADAEAIDAFLQAHSVARLDAVFVSRPVESRLGGMAAIVERYPVSACYLTADCLASPLAKPLLRALDAQGLAPVETMASFVSVIDWAENVELRVLSPHDVTYPSAEDRSLMLRLQYGKSAILLAGDAHALAERMAVKVLPNELLHADVLLAGDHGSGEASSQRFLSAVQPTIALISAGSAPPGDAALERLAACGARILRTDETGTLHILLDGAAATVVE